MDWNPAQPRLDRRRGWNIVFFGVFSFFIGTPWGPVWGATEENVAAPDSDPASDRVALTVSSTANRLALRPDLSRTDVSRDLAKSASTSESLQRALELIEGCRQRYGELTDYTCTFFKRERIGGRMTPPHVMSMKARTSPKSIYLRFQQPHRGREAIYVEGRNRNKVLAHDVGLNRLLAGTLELEPTSARAMEESRHPITKAGIGPLIDTIAERWRLELSPSESIVSIVDSLFLGGRPCLLIETVHTKRSPSFLFHKVRLFIDTELGLPVRFEGYDWPRNPGGAEELVEEYTYSDIRINVGLGEQDFDITNPLYSFGRF